MVNLVEVEGERVKIAQWTVTLWWKKHAMTLSGNLFPAYVLDLNRRSENKGSGLCVAIVLHMHDAGEECRALLQAVLI